MTKVILTKPIEAHGETISSLDLKELTGADITACGVPFATIQGADGKTAIQINAKEISQMISTLAGIPTSSVGKLSAADWMKAASAVIGFFGTSLPAS